MNKKADLVFRVGLDSDSAIISAFDEKDETLLLWHCGPAAARYCERNGYKLGCNYSGMAHEPNKGITARCGVARDMIFDDMPVTVMRFSGECDKILNMGGELMLPDKFSFCGSRGWCGNLTFNGEKIGEGENCHIAYEFDIKKYLEESYSIFDDKGKMVVAHDFQDGEHCGELDIDHLKYIVLGK